MILPAELVDAQGINLAGRTPDQPVYWREEKSGPGDLVGAIGFEPMTSTV